MPTQPTMYSAPHPIKRIAVALAVIVLLQSFAAEAVAVERHTAHGFTLPQPKRIPTLVHRRSATRPTPVSCAVRFEITDRGRVKDVALEFPREDSLVFASYRDSLLQVEFLAAELNGRKVSSTLEARLLVSQNSWGSAVVSLLTPIDSVGAVRDYETLRASCASAGVVLAQLTRFPPYFYARPRLAEDTASLYHFVLLEIDLDAAGVPVDRRVALASDAPLADMALTAAGWAEYSPAIAGGEAQPSHGFLLVRFFTEVTYPTKSWTTADGPTNGGLEQTRVSWWATPDLQSIDIPGVLRRTSPIVIEIRRELGRAIPASGLSIVDTLGWGRVRTLNGRLTPDLKSTLIERLSHMKYYPALIVDLTGSSEPTWMRRADSLALELTPVDSFTYHLNPHPVNR